MLCKIAQPGVPLRGLRAGLGPAQGEELLLLVKLKRRRHLATEQCMGVTRQLMRRGKPRCATNRTSRRDVLTWLNRFASLQQNSGGHLLIFLSPSVTAGAAAPRPALKNSSSKA